eukprot:TRINITY_DN2644_c0_g1_i1.p1 TRINITY_DN2644_c0_g1~~TRINITY_DN2644_c0_g1_i1.p1  ORF type:complete len:349 (-),score=74.68 TRINITY_DN2644_c0_g1_i1:122-1168(-)
MGEDDAGAQKVAGALANRRPSGLAKIKCRRQSGFVASAQGDNAGKPLRQIRHLGDEKIFDLYDWDEVLQEEGEGGKVVVCKPKGEDVECVMKMRAKKGLRKQGCSETFRRVQERLLNLPAHGGVVPMREVLEDTKYYYIVMEKASGGSFFEGLLSEFSTGVVPATEVRRLTREMLESVGHVHSQGMLHRDIKPDNFLMEWREDPDSPTGKSMCVMLSDFDHAEPDWSPATAGKSDVRCGTLAFNAPETFRGFFSERSDLYSIGVCLYLLMTGNMPYDIGLFDEFDFDGTYERMEKAEVNWRCDPWPDQPACEALCRRLLAFNPDDRVQSAEEARRDEWFGELFSPKQA